jgi:hypothetical protein
MAKGRFVLARRTRKTHGKPLKPRKNFDIYKF